MAKWAAVKTLDRDRRWMKSLQGTRAARKEALKSRRESAKRATQRRRSMSCESQSLTLNEVNVVVVVVAGTTHQARIHLIDSLQTLTFTVILTPNCQLNQRIYPLVGWITLRTAHLVSILMHLFRKIEMLLVLLWCKHLCLARAPRSQWIRHKDSKALRLKTSVKAQRLCKRTSLTLRIRQPSLDRTDHRLVKATRRTKLRCRLHLRTNWCKWTIRTSPMSRPDMPPS